MTWALPARTRLPAAVQVASVVATVFIADPGVGSG